MLSLRHPKRGQDREQSGPRWAAKWIGVHPKALSFTLTSLDPLPKPENALTGPQNGENMDSTARFSPNFDPTSRRLPRTPGWSSEPPVGPRHS